VRIVIDAAHQQVAVMAVTEVGGGVLGSTLLYWMTKSTTRHIAVMLNACSQPTLFSSRASQA
jgi:hypothetical protein